MALGDLYQQDVDAALSMRDAMPAAPPKASERGIWRTLGDSVRGAASKAMASTVEVGNVIGPALSLAADPSNAASLDAVKAPIDFGQTSESKKFRDFEKTLRPDPATATTAEQIVYGTVGPMLGLVGATVLGGPAGLAAAAGEAGFSQSQDLRDAGVDLRTRAAVGTLTAGVTAASAALPMAGPTLKATAGLYLAGGPAGFMLQQQATRSILESADYVELAKQYDPLDPVGLGMSALIPLPFAAYGVRANLRALKGAPMPAAPVAPTVPRETVDAAMVHNLTLQRDASEGGAATPATAAIPRDATLSPADRVAEQRLAEKVTSNFDAAVAEYSTLKDARGGLVLNTDVARELSADYLADRTRSAAAHEPASWFIKRLYEQKLAQIKPGDEVLFSSGGTGAGKTTAIDQLKVAEDSALIYDTNMNSLDSAVKKVEQALDAGATVRIVHVQRDPVEALTQGALTRAMRQKAEFGSGRTVPLLEHAKTHRGAAATLPQLAERYKADPRVQITVLDNTRGKGNAAVSDLAFVQGFNYNGTEGRLREALRKEFESGRISGDVFRATEGAAVDGPEPVQQPVRSGGGGKPEPQLDAAGSAATAGKSAELADIAAARQAMQDIASSGRAAVDFLSSAADLSAAAKNLVVGLNEAAGNKARADAMLGDFERTVAARPGASAVDIAADVVEASRAGREVTPENAKTAAPASPEKAVAESIAARVAEVEQVSPDLPVAQDSNGKPVTAAELMAQARREAQQGTDTELGAVDADLVQVAANCFLSSGAI